MAFTQDAGEPVLEIDELTHQLHGSDGRVVFEITVDQCISIRPGEFVSILGPSGCGKTTLLTILGLLRRPSSPESIGKFRMSSVDNSGKVQSHNIAELWRSNRQKQIEQLRRQCIGFALQSGDLLSSLTVRENIEIPLRLNGVTGRDCDARVNHLIKAFSLGGQIHADENEESQSKRSGRLAKSRINKLSGGEYQRVVLARSIAHRPRIAFVDEPTAALNHNLARVALTQLKTSMHNSDPPGAVLMITHDEGLAYEFSDMIIQMLPAEGRAAGGMDRIERRAIRVQPLLKESHETLGIV